ncbi:MAG TPA: allantoinase AllB [Gemmatimonadaceae bacterium]|nr:allantoinase AllB [Gemmatimonadaceae bacterium]
MLGRDELIDLVIRGRRVLTPAGVRPLSLHIAQGRIERVAEWDEVPSRVTPFDAGELLVMPGIVDTHVHVNEPGRTDWEGFETATRAAAAGGVTTLLDMPLNSVPATTSVKALQAKRAAARGKCAVNVEFIGGVVPGNAKEIEPLAAAGVRAFKCFLTPSGVDEFPAVGERELREALPLLARTGLVLMVHAEDPALISETTSASSVYAEYLASRPAEAERSAISMLVRLMERTPARVHIVHLSSSSSLEIVRAARARGLPISVETCPHYLTFSAQDVPDGATEYKCAPPIRSAADRDGLWEALIDGEIDLVASDHSPCPPELKRTNGDFFSAWGGIASLQLGLAAVWTGARARGVKPERLAQWMSAAPAWLAGLDASKGALAPGYDADVVIWDSDASFMVDPATLLHRHKVTPYAGRELFGAVAATFVGGKLVFADDRRFH